MKIGFVIPGGVDPGGRERVVPMFLWLIARIARAHELHVFVLDYYEEPRTYQMLGATIRDLGRAGGLRGFRRWAIERRLEAALRTYGPFDILHAYWGMPAASVTTSIALRLETPVVVTFDSGELVRIDDIRYGLQRRWIDRRAISRTLREATAVTVPTRFMAQLRPIAHAKPLVIPLGVDAPLFPRSEREPAPPWRLVRIGTINRVKDHATLLAATARLVQQRLDVHLDIVGEDTLDGEMQRLARELGVAANVTFHGFQPTERVSELLRRAHLNVVSSRHESANVTVLEAACTELATVGTAVGYVADWSPDRAVAVSTRNPAALAQAIHDLLNDPERRSRLARAARAWALKHDADWTAAAFESVYHRLVTPRPHRAR
jgi:glycosyltransferase involved in cell wall biosynthesis